MCKIYSLLLYFDNDVQCIVFNLNMQIFLAAKTISLLHSLVHELLATLRYIALIPLLFILLLYCYTQTPAQVIITEVYPQPRPGEPEWIECYNISTATLTLSNLSIQDNANNTTTIERLVLPPQSFIILTRDTLVFRGSSVNNPSAVLIQVRNLPILNNDSDVVTLNLGKQVIDAFVYKTHNVMPGISFERKDDYIPASYPDNVQLSRDIRGSTPGRKNSIALHDYDCALHSIRYDTTHQRFVISIENSGRFTLAEVIVSLYLDTAYHALPVLSHQVFTHRITDLVRGKHDIFSSTLSPPDVISLYCTSIISAKNDVHRDNDTIRTIVYIPYPPETVRINEIFAEPVETPDGYNAEWIEVYNSYHRPITLFSWFITDARRDTMVISEHCIVKAHSFGIITFDSAFFRQFPMFQHAPNVYCFPRSAFALNNDTDVIRLYDPNGKLHDSVMYSSRWHDISLESTRGRSLEKRSPMLASPLSTSWTSSGSITGSTPALPNSVLDKPLPAIMVEITPSPFRRTVREFCTLTYMLPFSPARLSIKIFDVNGVPLGDILNYTYTGASGSIDWDGRINAQPLPQGGYILFFEAVDSHTGAVCSLKRFLVIT